MKPLIDQVTQQLDDNAISQLSRQLGVDPNTTRQAIPAALTALVGGLSQNAANPAGAQQLAGALSRDHDGGILDDLAGFFGDSQNPLQAQGGGILGHIFGNRKPNVAARVGQAGGLDSGKAMQLLMLLAPLVLGALGRAQRQSKLDSGGLSDILGNERRRVEQAQPGNKGLLDVLLDRDGDGSILDDIAGMAGGYFGNKR